MLEEKRKKLIQKIKQVFLIKKESAEGENSNKRKIENIVVFIIILVITVILINTIWNGKPKTNDEAQEGKTLAKLTEVEKTERNEQNSNLEERLENILQNIEGVGKVKVLLTYSESSKNIAMYNEDTQQNDTEETDTNGGNRKIIQNSSKKEVIYQEVNGQKVPVTQSIIEPKIEGAIVTAIGARNSTIKENIVQAVGAATGLATHKIQVFEMSQN